MEWSGHGIGARITPDMAKRPSCRSPCGERQRRKRRLARGSVRRRPQQLGVRAEVERYLDRARPALIGDGGERVAPVIEAKRVGEHFAQVDTTFANQVEVVGQSVLADAA